MPGYGPYAWHAGNHAGARSTNRQVFINIKSMMSDTFVKTFEGGGVFEYRPGWIDTDRAVALLRELSDEIAWRQEAIPMFGRMVQQPRLLCFMGDAGVRYRYSGTDHDATPWHASVRSIRDRLERDIGVRFNSVLLNLYRDGRDSMGWHSDDEPELGDMPVIASISLGQERRFMLRARRDKSEKFEVTPASGSLIVMRGTLQRDWQHQVPKTARPLVARINLTFRRVLDRPKRRRPRA